jgi:hypothetical protein
MRRLFLRNAALFGLAAANAGSANASTPRKLDKRLIGTWRSDRELTMKYRRFKQELDVEKREQFAHIFGKMKKRFTATHLYSEFDNERLSGPYRVVAKDAKSVVIALQGDTGTELQQLVFENDYYYVLTGYNLEFFRRVAA